MNKFSHKERTYDDVRRFIGNGARRLIEDCIGEKLPEEEFLKRLNFYNDIYTSSNSPKTKVYDGIKEVLLELKNRGYYIAVITNKPQMTTDNVISNYFTDITFDEEKVYFIGDAETDYKVSKNAGVNGVTVLWGYRTKEELESVGAKTFVNVPSELLDILL